MTRFLSLITALLIILGASTSCQRSESADASDLLATVPSDASIVAVANVQAMLEKAGCKVSDDQITPSDEITSLIASFKSPQAKAIAEAFFNGKSDIDPSVALIFAEGYYKYVTGIAADPDKFKQTVTSITKQQFAVKDDIDICANVALKGNQFWVNLDANSIDPREAKHFATLSKEQSFLSNAAAERLSTFDSDIVGWANIAGALNASSVDFQQRAMLQVALQTTFNDAADATFQLTFNKGEMTGSMGILNSKGKPAKFLLASQALDMKTMESIGGNADILLAIGIPHKLIEQLQKDTQSKSASLLGVYLQALGAIDGTVAIASDTDGNAIRGTVTTNGQSTGQLTSFLDGLGLSVKLDGNMLQISKGQLTGNTPVTELAADLKGAVAGLAAANPKPGSSTGFEAQLKSFALTLKPASSSIELHLNAKSLQADQNFLLTLLRSADKK